MPATFSQSAGTKTSWHSYWRNLSFSAVAYANEVKIFLTSATDFQIIEDAIRLFEKVSGVLVNPNKSQSLPNRRWKIFDTVIGIAYYPSLKKMGVKFWITIYPSVTATWTHVTGHVRTLSRESFPRDLCLAHRIRYFHTYLLAKI